MCIRDSVVDLGDTIVYTITITNTGNVNLQNLTISDTLTDFNSQSLTLSSTPTFISGTNATASTINLGGVAVFRAEFTITQQAVDAGGVDNVAIVSAESIVGSTVTSDTSDDPSTLELNDPTSVSITATPSISVSKAASLDDPDNNGIDLGDTINYTIVVTNTGDLTLSNISVSDLLSDGNGTPLSLSQNVSLTSGDSSSLNVGSSLTYTACLLYTSDAADEL